MKKNAMLKVAAVVLVAVLLTTCAISSTFAKYVTNTTDKATASARVAAWGVEIDAGFTSKLNNLFLDAYSNTENNYDVELVAAYGEAELVAPGTEGSIDFTTAITGQPEVSGIVTLDTTVQLNGWTVEGDDYCPLVFTVDGTDFYIGGNDLEGNPIADSAALATAVAAAINEAGTQEFAAGDELDGLNTVIDSFDISWKWHFEAPSQNVPDNQTNELDSKLGNLAEDGNAPTVSISIGIKVEQTGAAVVVNP